MFTKFEIHKRFYLLLLLIIISNCQLKDTRKTHGILFLENRSNKLEVNKSNKNDAINILGNPHTKSFDKENDWIYFERVFVKGKYHNLGKNILQSNNILYLEFNKYGILVSKNFFNKDDIQKMSFSEKITQNDLSKKSIVESFFSSLKSKMYGKK